MNLRRITLCFVLLLGLAFWATPQSAEAQFIPNPVNPSLGTLGIGVHQVGGGRSFHEFARTIPRPFGGADLPYFALYPPVYYSHVVPRPYGYSPFALPPGVQPAESIVGPPESAEIINPFYKPNEEEKENELMEEVATKSKMIINPFFEQEENIAKTEPDAKVFTLRQATLRK